MHNTTMIAAIDAAIHAHEHWKAHLRATVESGHTRISSATACCDNQCTFGKWLYGPAFDPAFKASVAYATVRRLHAEFHKAAGSIIAYVERGNTSAAQFLLEGDYAERSDSLVRVLGLWKQDLDRQSAIPRAA